MQTYILHYLLLDDIISLCVAPRKIITENSGAA